MLRRVGYHVLEAAGPVEALDTLKQSKVGLVLTDITMPGMNGKEMVRRIDRSQQPDLKVLYMSGYSENIEPGADFLEKPFTSADLLTRVRTALQTTVRLKPDTTGTKRTLLGNSRHFGSARL